MTDPKTEQDEIINFMITWEKKVDDLINSLVRVKSEPMRQADEVRIGTLAAAGDLINTLRETLEEHGLPD